MDKVKALNDILASLETKIKEGEALGKGEGECGVCLISLASMRVLAAELHAAKFLRTKLEQATGHACDL